MYNILVFGMTQNPGGIESFIMNYYRHMNNQIIHMDFLCNSKEPIAYEDELVRSGSRCFHITARSQSYIRFHKDLRELFKEHGEEWDAIWVNVCSLANIDYLKYAKRYGIQRRIIHSHNSQNMDSFLRGMLHKWNKKRISGLATDFWSCSITAAEWFYSNKILGRVIIIKNAIDIESKRFDETKRSIIRQKNGWENKLVIGNIGRLHFQKNQLFLLDIFKEYLKNQPESILIMIGQGPDEEVLKKRADELQIKDNVFFAGVQEDIQAWLSCFDIFAFPSLFEGLSIAFIEAQANGLPIVISNNVIPKEIIFNNNIYECNLNDTAAEWSKSIDLAKGNRVDYSVAKRNLEAAGFDISLEAKKLESLFLKNYE